MLRLGLIYITNLTGPLTGQSRGVDMPHTRRTLLLDKKWDVTLDANGRIALVGDEYATAQNVGNEARLFIDDAYFRQAEGIPHFAVELGQSVSESIILRAHLLRAARRVRDVAEITGIQVDDFNPVTRQLSSPLPLLLECIVDVQ